MTTSNVNPAEDTDRNTKWVPHIKFLTIYSDYNANLHEKKKGGGGGVMLEEKNQKQKQSGMKKKKKDGY